MKKQTAASLKKSHQLLHIALLGGVRIELNGVAVTEWASRKAEALLAYLAYVPQMHERELVATLLWDDLPASRALGNLSVLLSSIRKAIGPFLVSTRRSVGLDWERPIQVDATVFAQQLRHLTQQNTLTQPQCAELGRVLELYDGDFLAGFYIRQASGFEEWALFEREHLQQMMINGLRTLMQEQTKRRNFAEAIQTARQLLSIDPLQESTHRDLMRLLALTKQRSAALTQFEICAQLLADELDVAPSEPTVTLVEEIRRGEFSAAELLPDATAVVETPAAPKHNLPLTNSVFIGRTAERTQIHTRLGNPACRLLNIVGLGGVGKTRLALQAAHELMTEFLDGVWFVSLATAQNLPVAIAEALRFSFSGSQALEKQLLSYIREKELLLVLDNMEHLVETPALELISTILAETAAVKLLVTSRMRLNLQAEWLLELEGLPFPAAQLQLTDELQSFTAVQLFTERVLKVQPFFTPTAADWAAITQICQLVEGHPLALELAAAWVRVLSCAEIAAEIKSNLDFLATTMHDVPPRHRSVQAVLAHSWQRLTAVEQTAMARLAIFRGGFTRTAARQVADVSLPLLARLIDQSLLQQEGHGRYRRHVLIYHFAREKLEEQPALWQLLAQQHSHYYRDFVTYHSERLDSEEAIAMQATLAADLDNILLAWRWLIAQDDKEAVKEMISPLYHFYRASGLYVDGEQVLREAEPLFDVQQQPAAVALLSLRRGRLYGSQGNIEEAMRLLGQSVQLAREAADEETLANALGHQIIYLRRLGEFEKALQYAQEAAAIYRKLGDNDGLAFVLTEESLIAHFQGDYEKSITIGLEALQYTDTVNNVSQMQSSHGNLGHNYLVLKKYDLAEKHYQEALQAAYKIGQPYTQAVWVHNLAETTYLRGKYEEAETIMREAYELFTALERQVETAIVITSLGYLYTDMGRYEMAQSYLAQALACTEKSSSIPIVLDVLYGAAKLFAAWQEDDYAHTLLTLIINHDKGYQYTKERAAELLATLPAGIQAQPTATTADFDDIVAGLQQKLKQPINQKMDQRREE